MGRVADWFPAILKLCHGSEMKQGPVDTIQSNLLYAKPLQFFAEMGNFAIQKFLKIFGNNAGEFDLMCTKRLNVY